MTLQAHRQARVDSVIASHCGVERLCYPRCFHRHTHLQCVSTRVLAQYPVRSPCRASVVFRRKLGAKVAMARSVIRELCGFAPYERRCMDLLNQGFDKRALKFCKKWVPSSCHCCVCACCNQSTDCYVTTLCAIARRSRMLLNRQYCAVVVTLCSFIFVWPYVWLFTAAQLGTHRRGKAKKIEMEGEIQALKMKNSK